MRGICLALLVLTGGVCFIPPGAEAIANDDTIETLVLLQMLQNPNDPGTQRSLYPLLLTSLLKDGDDDAKDNDNLFMLLLGAGGNNQDLQQWLPLILTNGKSDQDDKLLMLMFMQQSQIQGRTDSGSLFPLLLLNGNDDKYCDIAPADKCFCEKDNSEILLYMMMFNGQPQNPMSNFMFMLFNDDTCTGKKQSDDSACSCTKDEKIEGGLDMVTLMMLMQMNPTIQNYIPAAPPQRAIDAKSLIKEQLFQNLGPEYAWMARVGDSDIGDLVKFQLYRQMGIPPNVMGLLSKGGAQTDEEKFALVQYMAQFTEFNIQTSALMMGIEDSKQFFVHQMIEAGQLDPLTASMLLASTGSIDKAKMKELLVLAATGQVDPETFATIAKPFVPQLPRGVYPGQDLFFIHLELLDISTCNLIEPEKRQPCGTNFGGFITAEQCEVHPYCCYNPHFGDDAVPWCYYNVFFVFHDQYKMRVREADKFKGPADCPGLFRYGLNLDPFLYNRAVNELQLTTHVSGSYEFQVSDEPIEFMKLSKLIHLRKDIGYAGISEFHCRAILGACWDDTVYPLEYKIPQCYVEERIYFNDAVQPTELNLYDPKLFRPVVPAEFRGEAGECDTNYFHISTLYYERRACSYDAEMLKMGREFDPLSEPSREDCLFRLGCCYETDERLLAEYPFMPRCYKRVKDETIDTWLYEMDHYKTAVGSNVCGFAQIDAEIAILENVIIAGQNTPFTAVADGDFNAHVKFAAGALAAADGVTGLVEAEVCLFQRKNDHRIIQSAEDFWQVFDIFSKPLAIEQLDLANIPQSLRGMAKELF